MTEEKKAAKMPHNLILENRKTLTATGVSNVDSFDDQTVVAYTDLGQLIVKGSGLHISRLCIETGELVLSGQIFSMTYCETQAAGGLFSRLFK